MVRAITRRYRWFQRIKFGFFWGLLGLLLSTQIAQAAVGLSIVSPQRITAPILAQSADTVLQEIDSIETAWITINGRRIFEVAEAKEFSATRRARDINFQLADLVQSGRSQTIEVNKTQYAPTLVIDEQQLLTITENDVRVSQNIWRVREANLDQLADQWRDLLESRLEQALLERRQAYLPKALGLVALTLLIAVLAHRWIGLFWRNYLFVWINRITLNDLSDHTRFSAANVFLAVTQLTVRVLIWISAFLFITNLFPVTRLWSHRIQATLVQTFTTEALPIGEASVSILDLLTLIGWILLIVIGSRSLTNLLRSRILEATGISLGVQAAISTLVRYLVIFIGIIFILQIWGLDLSSLTLLASALGIGVGLGLQNIAKDIGSGLVLVFERPIQVGEFIEFGDYMGTVETIGPRSTEIRTLDQVSIIVPNSRFLEQEVINWSHRNPLSRIRIPIGVAYHSDPEAIRSILLSVGRLHPDVLAAPAPQVFFKNFGDNALDFELMVWVRNPEQQIKIKSDLNFKIATAFHENNIDVPFPQRDLHFVDGNLPISLNAETQALLARFLEGETGQSA